MNESCIRDFLEGRLSASELNRIVRQACEVVAPAHERFAVTDLDTDYTFTRVHALRLVAAAIEGALTPEVLSHVAFLLIASDRISFASDDDLLLEVIHDWSAPEINHVLTPETLTWFQRVLREGVPYPARSAPSPESSPTLPIRAVERHPGPPRNPNGGA